MKKRYKGAMLNLSDSGIIIGVSSPSVTYRNQDVEGCGGGGGGGGGRGGGWGASYHCFKILHSARS